MKGPHIFQGVGCHVAPDSQERCDDSCPQKANPECPMKVEEMKHVGPEVGCDDVDDALYSRDHLISMLEEMVLSFNDYDSPVHEAILSGGCSNDCAVCNESLRTFLEVSIARLHSENS